MTTKEKQRQGMLGRQNALGNKLTKKTIQKRIETRRQNGWFKNPEATKRKMSKNCATKRKDIRKKLKGPKSKKHKRKLSEARVGIKLSEKTKQKIREANLGEKCNFWIDGRSFKPYTTDWTNIFRLSIRKRDKYTCHLCGIKQQNNQIFDVHHIDYNKKNCNPYNLITLCRSCHSKTNCHRKQYKRAFLIVKRLSNKKILNLKTVKDFIKAMDLLIKIL